MSTSHHEFAFHGLPCTKSFFPRFQCILFGPGNESTYDWTNVSRTERHQSVRPMLPMMVLMFAGSKIPNP